MTNDTGADRPSGVVRFPPRGTPERAAVFRAAMGVGVATGAYGVSFGAIGVASGLNVAQTCVLSLFMFSGGSQFALVGILAAGGGVPAAAGTAALLGSRNSFYGLRLANLLRVSGWRRAAAAHLVIDESTAVATTQATEPAGRLGFWATGIAVFVLWNIATLLGAVGAGLIADPKVLGLDAAAPAAFAALLAPRMRGREPWAIALGAAAVALVAAPFVPAGVPVLLAAVVAIVAGLWRGPGPELADRAGEPSGEPA
ncbi:MAG TPA: AzlC family ABC transporter permease [Micromonosporaceae bacterium]|nr:AzlC family ABC transporter permease [Micromonosporaceae bacterium]